MIEIISVVVAIILLLFIAMCVYNVGFTNGKISLPEVGALPEGPLTRDEVMATLRAAKEIDDLEAFVDSLMNLPARQAPRLVLKCEDGGCDGIVKYRVVFNDLVTNTRFKYKNKYLCSMHFELSKSKGWIDASQELEKEKVTYPTGNEKVHKYEEGYIL